MKKSLLLCLLFILNISSSLFAQVIAPQVEEASKLYEDGDYKAVIKVLKPLEALPEINTQAEMLLGDAYHKQEEFNEAILHYDRAEKGGDKSFELYFHRARAYISIEAYKDATKDMDKAIQMQPENSELYFFRAYAETELGHLNKAVDDYSKAIELDGEFQEAYNNRAAIKIELQEYEGVLADLKKAQDLNPESEDVALMLARFSFENQNYEEAISLYESILDNSDDVSVKIDANYYIAESYDAMGETDSACKYFSKAMKLGDKDSEEIFQNYCEKNQIRTLFKPRKKLEKVTF
jgi:tetratricopeptide (TPR) repeat protein